MNRWSLSPVCVLVLALLSAAQAFERWPDGILVRPTAPGRQGACQVRLQVWTDEVIRVVASPTDRFSSQASLIVPQSFPAVPPDFSVQQHGDVVRLQTDKLTAEVSTVTGAVSFLDHNGRVICREKPDQSRIFTPATVMGESCYHVQQFFDSPSDEAFYGLGQHQNDVMNYKGRNVDLWQYNLVASVPVLVSSRHYGILWDNNSRTKFGDPRDYAPLSSLTQTGKDGQPGGLTAEYFSDTSFTKRVATRREQTIDHEYLGTMDRFPNGLKGIKAVRWSGSIRSDRSGHHSLRLYSSSFAKVWLDGKLVLDSWRQNWCPWTHFFDLNMQAGQRVDLKIEWIPDGGYIGLRVLSPSAPVYQNHMSLSSEVADQIDYYFMAGDNLDEVIHDYRTVTGKAPMMPKWAMGLWQCRERYKTQDELLNVVKEFRQRHIPLDNIVQDWLYWPQDQWGSHDFDPNRYPNPVAMTHELHDALHTHIMISVWPKFYVGTEHYQQFLEHGWLYIRNIEVKDHDWVGPGYVSTFYDPYSAGARQLFWQQINTKLFSKHFDAWWLDATEPDIHSNIDPNETLRRIGPTALGTAARDRNTFSLMNAKGIYEGQRRTAPNQRVFILTRSAYAGQQRYAAATWSGDVATRWYDLKAQIAAGLNFCLSGLPYWTTDIGGFAVEPRYEHNVKPADLKEWRELNTRWFQFGTFCPLFRVHGQYPYREMFNLAPPGHPAYQTELAYDKLRYRLMPYIYSLTGMVTQDDYTLMRALVMDFGNDLNVLDIGDQFMFGPALMINPVTRYQARQRPVYLPARSGWYNFKSGVYFTGGRTIQADAPYTDIPIFVKAGSIIPIGPAIQYTGQKPADPIRLLVYTGQNASFSLYEDQGTNTAYEHGAFTRIPIHFDQASGTLTLGQRTGAFPGMLKQRTFQIVWITLDKAQLLNLDGTPDQVVRYDGHELKVKMPI